MRADACLGYIAMGYQIWEVTSGIPDARKFNLIRPAEPVADGRDAKVDLTQKANVGLCPCCVQAT